MTSRKDDRTKLDPNTPTDGRALQEQNGPKGGRGNSIQGEHQDAKGGPAGANQGGASRGTSRLEPSHARKNHHESKHATNKQRNEKK
jgi:hypothetical protein